MALSREQMDRTLDEHFGFEAADDVEGVLSTLTEDVEHDIVGWPAGPSFGKDQTRAFYEATFADLTDGQVKSLRRFYGDDFMVDESLWSGVAKGQPFGVPGHGKRLEFRLLHILEFSDTGTIRRENVWIDLGAIQRQLS